MIAFRVAGLVLPAAIMYSSTNALPRADGSKCNANWVNNAGAMNCFIQGQQDIRNGVAHPHYVACTSAGEVFCCVDDDKGNQSCEVEAAGRHSTIAQQLGAILNGQLTIMETMKRLSDRMDRLESGGVMPQGATPGSLFQPPAHSGSPTGRGGG